MADVINLRQARKRKIREDSQISAAANRALHGRSKAARAADEKRKAAGAAHLDAHQREIPQKP